MTAAKLQVTLRKSTIGRPNNQRRVVRGLGLRRINSSVVVANEAAFRGMIKKVLHLVEVEELES